MLEELKDAANYLEKKIRKYKDTDLALIELEKEAESEKIPIITREVSEYLKFVIRSYNIKDVLEIGTATGYSGVIIAKEIEESNGILYTIEIDEVRYNKALKNFEKFQIKNIIPVKGDALEEISKLEKTFDMVFIDASKGHYMNFFEDSYKILKKNGIMFIDNILFRGYLYKDHPKRFKTIVGRLDKFIEYLYSKEDNFVLLPFGDGVGILKKREG
ncbi:O-methyltransferase [Fusobacterium sp. PH5-44]|uniref:O-methyltransferase n=1 Tax=unclassified Fusobacterium TaxID=2648384 RepID=UPI003D1FC6CD